MRIGFRLLLAVVVVLGLGLGAGLAAYQSSQQPASGVASAAQNGAGRTAAQIGSGQGGQQQRGGAPATGVVASVGDKEFSLKSDSSATPIVVRLDDQTSIRKQVAGALSDVKPGETITVRGETKADATIAASTVQLIAAEGATAPFGAQRQTGGQSAPSGTPSGAQGQPRGQRAQAGTPSGAGAGTQGGQGVLTGTVKEVADKVVSVARLDSAGTETVIKVSFSDQTSVTKTDAGEIKDIAEGASVTVVGARGTDGTITATSVQILPPEATGASGRQQ